ncbi:hypothetical protein COCVIDRAFT_18361 [Bipolaris victoriae FI3]|uniref:Cyanovirin-N domain-containing protein n=1 Tax=Bipolaris victoriae (strain FI3) TaxID=930091 RepID=W7EIX2_BIPV3|nr:hypothetical protein COCVIDRAFT_18361 [Bipolaris victoriae FI3]
MYFTSTLVAFLGLSSGALGYKFTAFSGRDCTGDAKDVNVWDNTCRDQNIPATQSFRILNLGGNLQKADFYDVGNCVGSARKIWWADGRENAFQVGKCITLGYSARAFGSRSG